VSYDLLLLEENELQLTITPLGKNIGKYNIGAQGSMNRYISRKVAVPKGLVLDIVSKVLPKRLSK